VKPANFLWDYESGEGVLVDFGLAEVSTNDLIAIDRSDRQPKSIAWTAIRKSK
jgi:serine/threonine protein kinase